MSDPDLVVRGRRVVTPSGVVPAAMYVRNGVIERVAAYEDVAPGAPLLDAGDAAVMPGVVDTHVHVNQPGRTPWEGFETATRAAAAGGVTTLVDMPLNSIPATTSVRALETKCEATEGLLRVDLGLWGGAVPNNAGELRAMVSRGALGFKCFLVDSGVQEFPFVTADEVRAAMVALHGTDAVLMVHAELPGPIDLAAEEEKARGASDKRSYARYVRSRPRAAEDQAVELLFGLCSEIRSRTHIVHLSSSGGLDALRRARDAGLPLTAETAPHYLHFAAENIPDGATQFKCAPPIREAENREKLWDGLRQGLISMVVSDHSPCTPDLKRLEEGDFDAAWGGIASLQFELSAVWTEARRRGFDLTNIAEWMCAAPARHAGIHPRKGVLRAGADADFVIFHPERSFRVETSLIEHRNKVTPYAGETLDGVVEATFVRGREVFHSGNFPGAPAGRFVHREGR